MCFNIVEQQHFQSKARKKEREREREDEKSKRKINEINRENRMVRKESKGNPGFWDLNDCHIYQHV